MKTVKSNIYGNIHGVGFKYFVMQTALSHRIGGYVKTESDGAMSIVAYGQDEQVDDFFKLIEAGNGYSKVDFIALSDCPTEVFREFRVIY